MMAEKSQWSPPTWLALPLFLALIHRGANAVSEGWFRPDQFLRRELRTAHFDTVRAPVIPPRRIELEHRAHKLSPRDSNSIYGPPSSDDAREDRMIER
jgi:hypothetical protein